MSWFYQAIGKSKNKVNDHKSKVSHYYVKREAHDQKEE